ncbi:hypothetical protein WJX81_004071 [Elliptochloris bilobata]|uniref:PUA domain-containing protein n=1 Tax=Elliptochloris bilobata TaxID=381761 RepID=A0AAW1SJF1_9CHLO
MRLSRLAYACAQVIKVGTSSLVRPDAGSLNLSNLARICETVRDLRAEGHRVVLVSSGAVGVGAQRLGLAARPADLAQRQALAAVGQVYLMRYYEDFFSALGLVLLTLDNLAQRGQYLNASNTFRELFAYGTVPVVNENDTVAVEELRIGDNDTLSAQVATLVRADWLVLLTDVDALYTANPATDPAAQPIHEVADLSQLHVDTSEGGGQWGTGGMATKLTAARLATAAGCAMAICSAAAPERVAAIVHGERVGTVFWPLPHALRGRKRWILSVPLRGELWMDAGAVRAVRERSKSLFSAGIVRVSGDFAAQDAVRLCDAEGVEFARGLCNYACSEVERMKGKSSRDFAEELGYVGSEEVVHRDNVCQLTQRRPSSDASHGHDVHGGRGGNGVSPEDVAGRLALLRTRGGAHDGAARPAMPHTPSTSQLGLALDGATLDGGRPGRGDPAGGGGGGSGGRDGVAQRLELLKQRGGGLSGQCASDDVETDGWKAEMARAIAAERSAEDSPSAAVVGSPGSLLVGREADVTDEGWLPE